MRTRIVCACLVTALLAGCREFTNPGNGSNGAPSSVRVVNAFGVPVDVFVDGSLVVSGVPPGELDTVAQPPGDHAVGFAASGGAPVSVHVTTVADGINTVAAVRIGAALAASDLDDTAAIVPAGATKVRVLHLAPSAGEISVYRTQPDWGTPIAWQFPFTYDSVTTGPGCPYYQSTVGTWDVRAWRTPSEDSLGWAGTTAHVTVNLRSGEKRTVLVLDKPGGGIKLRVID
ncbi:MAG TPA: DUF4397 domain-containing protein [Gemmatimonadales bacterium]|nr:DUF4397 domain-containing protein [Gemmatimonadales bacterium]